MKISPSTRKGVLVVGAGFLGSALAERLSSEGVVVNLLSPHANTGTTGNIKIHQGGMEDETLVDRLVSSCHTVVHAASASTPSLTANSPLTEGTRNILPTLHLLEVLQRHPGVHLIYLSSGGCIYGDSDHPKIEESHRLLPKSYHGAGKVAVETFLQIYRASNPGQRSTTILRPSNLYGPHQSLRDGFGLVRTVLENMRIDSTLEIWGNGQAVRDFIYIDDLVEACMQLVQNPQDNETYNVASGHPCSVNQLIDIAKRACGKALRVRYCSERQTDVHTTLLDSTKIRQKLRWQPKVSLEDGISRTWNWLTNK